MSEYATTIWLSEGKNSEDKTKAEYGTMKNIISQDLLWNLKNTLEN
jgi:hypothetical protein